MKFIDGIEHINKENYSIFFINGLTSDIKTLIKNNLSFICYGRSASNPS